MKLSDVKGERVFDVMAELVGPICNIATSKAFKAAMEHKPCPDGMDPREFGAQRIRDALPEIIKEHRNDIVAILATIGGVEPSEYMEGMTIVSLWSDVMELVADGDFLDFLSSLNTLME